MPRSAPSMLVWGALLGWAAAELASTSAAAAAKILNAFVIKQFPEPVC
jgi:hypothetical protein